jgi:hypothetical protein
MTGHAAAYHQGGVVGFTVSAAHPAKVECPTVSEMGEAESFPWNSLAGRRFSANKCGDCADCLIAGACQVECHRPGSHLMILAAIFSYAGGRQSSVIRH